MNSHDRPGVLDEAIDAAVRGMMQVDPRPGLRHRVTRSIGARPSRFFGFRLGLAAAAMAVMILAAVLVVVQRSPGFVPPAAGPQVAKAPPAARAVPPAGPRAREAAAESAALTLPGPLPVATRARRRTVATPESIFGPRSSRVAAASVPGLADEPADAGLAVDVVLPLAGRTAISPIIVAPIGVTPLAIEPLSVSALPTRR